MTDLPSLLAEFQQIPVGSQRWHILVGIFIGVLMRERIEREKAEEDSVSG